MTRPTPPVTPTGVRDGDPDSLAGLAQRRSGSVLDYARHACGEAASMDATAEAFARFRGAVVAADDPYALAPDPLLLSCTRNAAAAFTPAATSGPECSATPFLIIGRYEGTNAQPDEARLTRHLATCAACTERAAAFDRAERAFRAPHPPAPDGAIVDRVIAALRSAGPILVPQDDTNGDATGELVAPPAVPVAEPRPEPEPRFVGGDAVHEHEDAATGASAVAVAVDAPPAAAPTDVDITRRVVIPAAIVTTGVVVAMAVAGVFGGTDPAPARGETGLPAPTPPARPPAADDEEQSAAARAARAALRRIRAREALTARRADEQRAAEAATPDDESAPSAPSAPSSGAARPPSRGNDEGREPTREAPADEGGGDLETVPPETQDPADSGSGVFEPAPTPTP